MVTLRRAETRLFMEENKKISWVILADLSTWIKWRLT